MIRDLLNYRIKFIKKLLFEGDKLTLAKALWLTQAIETANKDVQLFQKKE